MVCRATMCRPVGLGGDNYNNINNVNANDNFNNNGRARSNSQLEGAQGFILVLGLIPRSMLWLLFPKVEHRKSSKLIFEIAWIFVHSEMNTFPKLENTCS